LARDRGNIVVVSYAVVVVVIAGVLWEHIGSPGWMIPFRLSRGAAPILRCRS